MPTVWKATAKRRRPRRDSLGTLGKIYSYQQEEWVKRGNWDGRVEFEKERPFKELLPHQQRWLKRMKPYKY